MGFLFICLNQAAHQVEGMLVRRYGRKHGAGGMFFNAIICLFSMFFFVITDRDGFYFPPLVFVYGFISCLMFAAGFYSMYLALQLGSYAITRLISSFSGVLVIFYGLLVLHESMGLVKGIAILLVFLSVFIMNWKPSDKSSGEAKGFSVKWLLCTLISLISNALIAILQRQQQIAFDKACDNEFMILSLGGAFLALMLMGFVLERGRLSSILRYGTLYGMGAGLMNGAANFMNLLIYLYMPISVASPLRTGLGIVTGFVISYLVYKEKFDRRKLVGALLGFFALILLSLGK